MNNNISFLKSIQVNELKNKEYINIISFYISYTQ